MTDYSSANNENTTNGQWLVFINHKQIYLDSETYLNHLFEESKKVIKNFDKRGMLFLSYDFQEIKEYDSLFYEKHRISINSEISTLQRLSNDNITKFKK